MRRGFFGGKERALGARRVALIKSLIYIERKNMLRAQGCQIQLKVSADTFFILFVLNLY